MRTQSSDREPVRGLGRDLERDAMRRQGIEAAVFLVASAVGIYGLGQGLTGLFVTGQLITLGWLVVTGITFFVLFAQMGRVHDSWPHRPRAARSTSPESSDVETAAGHEVPARPESR